MKLFARGQRSRLDALTPATELSAALRLDAPGLVIDISCFGLDERGQLADDRYFVFYNQPASPQREIEKSSGAGGEEIFRVDLGALPQSVRRLVFTASVDGAGEMSQLRSGHFALSEAGGSEVARYEFSGRDFASEGALMVAELYWKDGWRVAAVGQGFGGGLSALLKHFGGEEAEDSATPAPTRSAPQSAAPVSVPAAPVSPPALQSSAPVTAISASARDGNSLQNLLDSTPVHGTVRLGPGEFEGPVVVRRPVTIEGEGGVIWARSGPVVTVEAVQVGLVGVEIQVTETGADSANFLGDVALWVPASTCRVESLRVRGRVVGAGQDESVWSLPESLDLGILEARSSNAREIALAVPSACSLSCSVAGASVVPASLEAGAHRVVLSVGAARPGSFVCGRLDVRAGEVTRTVWISGRGE